MPEIGQTKRCSGCEEVKAITEFFKNKRSKDGLQNYCKACVRTYKQQWRDNPEQRQRERDYARNHRQTHPELTQQSTQRWHEKHPEGRKEASRRWRVRHREKHLASLKRYRDAHKDQMRESTKRWKKSNPEKARESTKRWWRDNKERGYALLQKREARKKAAPGVFTGEDIKQQYAAQGGKCAWCSVELNGRYQIDHVIALSRGGSNWPWNLVCACGSCNSSKKGRIPFVEWQPPNPLAGITREWVEGLVNLTPRPPLQDGEGGYR